MGRVPSSHHSHLAAANTKAWSAQNRVDKLLEKLKDAYSFAEPILKAKLRERYNVDIDVKNTYLRLYAPKETPWYIIHSTNGYTARTVSLLDAALHNFSYNETFEKDSEFITRIYPDQEQFLISPIGKKITISQFVILCRELDIGSQYKAHLENILLSNEPVADTYLKIQVQESQRAMLESAAHMAFVKKDISRSAHILISDMLNGRDLSLDGQHMQVCELGMMDVSLTGILIIFPHQDREQHSQKVIAYVPHDPEHPLKEYSSAIEFMKELTRQLRENNTLPSTGITYHQFFSQFVDHEQRGHFFAGLEQRLTVVKWHAKEPTDPRPSWRESPVDNPKLQFSALPITGSLWTYLYQRQLNKILNDARGIAVSTADADSNARWAWWDNFKKIVSDIFNVTLMVLTPFVPGLGELMLVYTAYQLTHDVIEGAVDLAEGLWTEGAEHIVGVVSDVVQLIAIGAGVNIANVFKLKISSFIEGTKPVQLPNGETRLWRPDLLPYEHKSLALPEDSKPDAFGVHRLQGKDILALEDRHYVVQAEPRTGLHRIQHPTRSDAYAPKLRHNGRGAWVHEGEDPRTWDSSTLMKRLGHTTDGFNHQELENIRLISGTDVDSLRRMHVESAPPPFMLDDTLKRFRAFDDVRVASQQIRAGRPIDPSSYWFQQLVTDLPGWPADCALKVYQYSDLNGDFRLYGNSHAQTHRTLSIGLPDVMAGKLPEEVVNFLDEDQLENLLDSRLPKQKQVQALRDRLADLVDGRKADISDYLYRMRETSNDSRIQKLQRQYPDLPTPIAERLIANAAKNELDSLADSQRIPLGLGGRARECAFETHSTRAYEGFYETQLLTPDTERLALNVLRIYSDTYKDLRIEIRSGVFDGPLRCSAGPDDAANVRMLLRDEQGRYEVRDDNFRQLSGAADLYESILSALPEDSLQALGYRPGQGRAFKRWLMDKTQAPAERRTLLLKPSIRPVPELETQLLLRGPSLSRQPATIEQRVKNLYPHLSEQEVDTFVRSLPTSADPVHVVKSLEKDLNELSNLLDAWKTASAPFVPDEPPIPPAAVRYIADRLLECFQRKPRVFDERSTRFEGGYALDFSTEFLGFNLELWWKKLPDLKKYLDQVTTLNLDGMRFSQRSAGLLKDFAQLRQFSARRCELTRLPEAVSKMPLLETLRLSDNRIELTAEAVEQLKSLTHLQTLRLEHNPLGRVPNVERMPRLKVLNLAHTDIKKWPTGLLARHRPRGFFLDLQDNSIMTIPDVVPGSPEAFIVARARLSIDSLPEHQRQALFDCRQSVGLPRQNAYAPLAANARDKWPLSNDSSLWGNRSRGLGAYREEAWDNLMSEPNSEGFFRVIDNLTTSADYRAQGPARVRLSHRVWELIDAMDLDTPLREKLFQTAQEPTTCEDASSELFNIMGVQALASQAYAYSTSTVELETRLVNLCKGAARLDRVNEIARADALSRPSRAEEVEIYLAYQSNLAQRLDLPWQSEDMLFHEIAGVSEQAIDQACETVLAREQGDGLVNGMLEQPFWEKYLRETYPDILSGNDRHFDRQMELLEDRRAMEPMTDSAYSHMVNDLAYQRLETCRGLTRRLLVKHRL